VVATDDWASDDWATDRMPEEMLEMAESRELSTLVALERADEVAEAGGDTVAAPELVDWMFVALLPPAPAAAVVPTGAQRAYGSLG